MAAQPLLHLLDASVLIDAGRDYYRLSQVPEFWEWLLHVGKQGLVKIPVEIFEEVVEGKSDVSEWLKKKQHKRVLVIDESIQGDEIRGIVNGCYASDLTEDEIEVLGRDPFLVAYALRDKATRCIVTSEASAPSKMRQNRKLPDVCRQLGVICKGKYSLTTDLAFSTKWKSQ